MLKRSKKSLLLAAALLVPATGFAQEKTDAPVQADAVVVEVVIEGEEVAEAKADSKEGKKAAIAIVKSVAADGKDGADGKKGADGKDGAHGSHQIRMIEINGDDVPQNINVILEKLKGLEAASIGKDGQSKVLSFTFGTDEVAGDLQAKQNAELKKAMKMIDLSVEGLDADIDGQVIRVLQNIKPGNAQLRMLNGNALKLKNLTDAMGNLNGTISISTSSNSSSKDGEKPKVVTNSQFRFIGPDGIVQDLSFDGDGNDSQSVSKVIEKALKDSGKDLPADIQKKVQEAMKRAEARTQAIWVTNGNGKGGQVQNVVIEEAKKADKASKSIESKLELILQRLDKMQQQIDALEN